MDHYGTSAAPDRRPSSERKVNGASAPTGVVNGAKRSRHTQLFLVGCGRGP
jgi:hypothetical protein